jgi:glycosyltransferase involved in cell wall biosynthesis
MTGSRGDGVRRLSGGDSHAPRREGVGRRLSIALVANWYLPFPGGAQIVVHHLAQALSARHAVTVLTPRRSAASAPEERERAVHVRRCRILNARRLPHLGRKPWAPGILRELLRGAYDAVVAFPALGPGASMAAAAARLRRMASFLFVFDLIDYRGEELAGFPDERRVRSWLYPAHRLKRRVRHARLRAFDGLFALGSAEAKVLSEVVRFCALLPVCVDPGEFTVDRTGRRDGRAAGAGFHVGCVGRITPHKGQDLAIRAFALARPRLGPAARLTLAGAVYDEAYYRSLLDLRRELGLEREVDVRRDLSRQEVLDVYAECDAHVVPVRFLSGGSIVQEAWAAGKPVVQSDRIDPDLVREGVDGLTFRYPSAEELAGRLLDLAADPPQARRMGESGRLRVEEVFNYARLARSLEEALALAGDRPPGHLDARAVEEMAWGGEAPSRPAREAAAPVRAG